MGSEKWYDLAYDRRDSFDDVEVEQIVYGNALAQRNNALLAGLPSSERHLLKSIRDELFYLGMACIAVETSLAGGGTYAIHLPKELYVRNERLLGDVIRPGGKVLPRKDINRIMYEQITRMRTFKLPPGYQHSSVGITKPDDVRRFGFYAEHHFHRLRRLVEDMDERRRNLVVDFMHQWVVEYMDIRGQQSLLSGTLKQTNLINRSE